MIKISDLEFMVPNAAHPAGSVTFKIEAVVSLEEVTADMAPNEELNVNFSEETVDILETLRVSIVKDLQNQS